MNPLGWMPSKNIFNSVSEKVDNFFTTCGKKPVLSTVTGAIRITANLVRSVASLAGCVGALAVMGFTKLGSLAGSTNCETAFRKTNDFGGRCINQFKKGLQGANQGATEAILFGVLIKEKVSNVFQERLGKRIEDLKDQLEGTETRIKDLTKDVERVKKGAKGVGGEAQSKQEWEGWLNEEIQNRDTLQEKLNQLKLRELDFKIEQYKKDLKSETFPEGGKKSLEGLLKNLEIERQTLKDSR